VGNSFSFGGVFSADGTQVLFSSGASNLVAGGTNGTTDLFVKDLATGAVTLVSATAAGGRANSASSGGVFSADGTRVLFTSSASNLVARDTNGQEDLFVKDLATGAVTLVSTAVAVASADVVEIC
jgi:Tol biopolymer transport system component